MPETVFQPGPATGKDSWLWGSVNQEDTNYGDSIEMECGYSEAGPPNFRGPKRSLGEFDISSIPAGSKITTVALDIWIVSAAVGGFDAWVRRMIQPAWVEGEATWNIAYTGADGWDGAGLKGGYFTTDDEQAFTAPFGVGTPYFKTISGPGLVAQCQWALDNFAGRYMWEMMKDVESGATNVFKLSSSEAAFIDPNPNPRPRLTVNYTLPTTPRRWTGGMHEMDGGFYG